jgi:hypothetical protein
MIYLPRRKARAPGRAAAEGVRAVPGDHPAALILSKGTLPIRYLRQSL